MAAKFDGKHARANMWVTHQNLARQKGGRPGYQFQEKKVPRAPRVVVPTGQATQSPADTSTANAESKES